jgi:iturin family lipopeptide synthetase B
MKVHEIIARLTAAGAKITVVDDSLKVNAPKGAITPELAALIRDYKTDIIEMIAAPDRKITPAAPLTFYPLSSAQKGLYFIHQLESASLAYNTPIIFSIEGALDKQRLVAAFNKLVARHEILRTSFELVEEAPRQRVHEQVSFQVNMIPSAELEDVLKSFVRPFDLAKAPLFRVGLVTRDDTHFWLILDIHHIIADGISQQLLLRDFMLLYRGEELPEAPLQYKDYITWQQAAGLHAGLQRQRRFWLDEFSEEVVKLDLPLDFQRPAGRNYRGDGVDLILEAADVKRLNAIAAGEKATMFMLVLSLYNILLSRLANQPDMVVGIVTSGRQQAELADMIGLFINTLPVRNYVDADITFSQFLAKVRAKTLACFDNEEYPYELLVDELHLERDPGRNPLFDAMLMYQNMETRELVMPGLQVKRQHYGSPGAKFDLTLTVNESEGALQLTFEYPVELFAPDTIKRFAAYFKRIVDTVIGNRDIRIADIDVLSAEEKHQLLREFNDTEGAYPRDETIVSLFRQQVQRTPEKTALVYGSRTLSFRELDQLSDRIAGRLQTQYGIGPDDLVGIMSERSENMLAGMLGILKSGAAYVPLDPVYPADRIAYILEDSKARLLLLGKDTQKGLAYEGPALRISELLEENLLQEAPEAQTPVAPDHLCYVIYTSGSTGLPKGVMISHRNVLNFFAGMSRSLPANEEDSMLAVTSTSFDISVLELFWTLCKGIEVVLHPADVSLGNLDQYVPQAEPLMDFSLFFFSSYEEREQDKYELLLKSVQYADKEGFNAVWTPERHFHEFGGLYPNPAVLSSALAMITKQIQIRSGSIVAPLHNAIRIAEDWAIVDNLSGGRVGLSFAAGWNPNDFILATTNYQDRYATMYEQITLVKKLWAGESIQRTNSFGKEVGIRIYPRPLQQELPIWVTASGSDETFKGAGAAGAHMLTHLLGQDIAELTRKIKLYREARAANGHDPDAGKVSLMLHTYLGEDIREIEAVVERPFIAYLKSSIGLSKIFFEESGILDGEFTEEMKEKLLKNSFKRYYKTASLIGTKQSCSEMIYKLKAAGVNEIACLVDFGIATDKVMEGLQYLKELKDLFAGRKEQAHKPVTMIQSTPSFLKLAKSDPGSRRFLESIRLFLVGGEALPLSLVRELKKDNKAEVYNMYGPTETTVWSCVHHFGRNAEQVTVGKPILNTRIYILDKDRRLLPLGVPGDLYIAGEGLAKGYWGRPELTAARFVPDPFYPGERMYMTGDVARWLPDGNIAFIGRQDHQVKLKGFRIELGEIEHRIQQYSAVGAAVALVKERPATGEKELVAYFVAGEKIDAAGLRAYLGGVLPYYMVPAHFVQMEQLPLTPNGKLDRKALPDPESTEGRDYVAPQTAKERLLVQVWAKVLDNAQIGVNDNFFAAGGDSIRSIQIISRLRNEGFEISVKDIFNYQTIRELAPRLKATVGQSFQGLVSGTAPLTPVQRWLFDSPIKARHHYNQTVMLHFPQGITADLVQAIFAKVQEHHDALRTVFRQENGDWVQETKGAEHSLSITELDFSAASDPEQQIFTAANSIHAGVELHKGPLLRLGLFHMNDGSRLLIVINHLIVDGISWRILFEDVETLYQQLSKKEPLQLPLKTDAFRQWSEAIWNYANTHTFKKAAAYWDHTLHKALPPIPRDYPAGKNILRENEVLFFELSKADTARFLKETHFSFGTQINDILLAALLLGVRQSFDLPAVAVDVEGHGREDIGAGLNISRTIGWFTSIFRVILESTAAGLGAVIKQVKETLNKVPNKGIDYLLYGYTAQSGLQAGAQIFFNYLGQFDADTSGNAYSLAKETTGIAISREEEWHYDWDIVGQVLEGKLHIKLTYSTLQYKEATIRRFLDAYEASLLSIINYCSDYGKQELTPSDLTYTALSIAQTDELQAKYPLQDLYQLSPMQEALLFHYLLDTGSDHYFLQISHKLKGRLDLTAVHKSVTDLVARYDILRTIFLYRDYEKPLQMVLKEKEADFVYEDLREECLAGKDQVIQSYHLRDRSRKFELDKDVLIRLTVLRTGEEEYEFIWSYHHILMDGWCIGIIIEDFREIYAAHMTGRAAVLPPVKPYSEYITWLEELGKEAAVAHWRSYLSAYESLATLPGKTTTPAIQLPYKLVTHAFTLGAEKTKQLQELTGKYAVTLNTIFQVAWGILLSKYNNAADAVFGSVIAGRPLEIDGVEKMVGLFINTVPVRVQYTGADTIVGLLRSMQDNAIESDRHNYLSLSEIQSLSELGRGLLDHIMIFDNYPVGEQIDSSNAPAGHPATAYTISDVRMFEQTNYDFTIAVVPGANIQIRLDYNAHAFDAVAIERIGKHLCHVLDQVVAGTEKPVGQIVVTPEAEQQQLLYGFNDTAYPYPDTETITSLFEKQAAIVPDNIALRYEDEVIGYGMLQSLSEKIAAYLQSEIGVSHGDLVGVMLQREMHLLPLIFGILKAGAAYVPIDPHYPSERIRTIVADAGLKALISRQPYAADGFGCDQIIDLDEDLNNILSWTGTFNDPGSNSHDLAYVIYTSGSTGKPKGVMVEHHSVINRLLWMQRSYPLDPSDVLLQKTPLVFDVSVWELFWWSFTGASLYLLPPGGEKDPALIQRVIREQQITTLHFVPSMLNAFLSSLDGTALSSIRRVFASGEALSASDVHLFGNTLQQANGARLINLYGPTEATVDVSCYECLFEGDNTIIPIGKPIDNIRLYVLDQQGAVSPLGVAGELCIAGVGLARGYLNNPLLTAEKFIDHPLLPGERIYKTGDLVKWLPDGNLAFLGRIDHQVKLRGYRIELGEIESCLNSFTGITSAAVLARSRGANKYLVAYYVSAAALDEQTLRAYLQERLPEYMVPAVYVHLDTLPLTVNGKLDRKALPDPVLKTTQHFIAPLTKEEKLLAAVWSKVLGIDPIGVRDNFFAIGGDSIRSIQISSRMRSEGYELSVKDILANPLIKEMALKLKPVKHIPDQSPVTGEVALAPVQRWFLGTSLAGKQHYNQSVLLHFTEALSVETVSRIFAHLQTHHDVLRTVFREEAGGIVQQVQSPAAFPLALEEHDLRNTADAAITLQQLTDRVQAGIDLQNGPLMRIGLIHMQDGDRLLVVIHHLLVDGVSWRVLFEDIEQLYGQVQAGATLSLPLKTDPYRFWTAGLQQYMQCAAYQQAKLYWDKFTGKRSSGIERDHPEGRNKVKDAKRSWYRISANETKRLLTRANASFHTQVSDILLTALLLGIWKAYNREEILLDLEGHGREDIGTGLDVSRTIGWFTSIYPVSLQKAGHNLAATIKGVKETLRQVPNNGLDYLLRQYLDTAETNTDNSARICFNYLGQFDADISGRSYKLAAESTGRNISPDWNREYDWEVLGMITGGELEISLVYSPEQYRPATIEALMSCYKDSLLELIDYCCTYNKVELTPSDLSCPGLSQSKLDELQQAYALTDVYPLSPMQEGILFHSLLSPDSDHYFQQVSCRISGELDIAEVERSMNDLLARYDVLRTLFLDSGWQRPLQLVLQERKIDFSYKDVQDACAGGMRDAVVQSHLAADRGIKFRLDKDVLLRLLVLQTGASEYELIWSHHHIIMDGWCMGIILQDFREAYALRKQGAILPPSAQPRYGEYISWLSKTDTQASENYWKDYLQSYEQLSGLPKKALRSTGNVELAEHRLVLGTVQTKRLAEISGAHGVTLSNILHAAWGLLLAKYNNVKDVVFGSVVSGRPAEISGIENMVGLFINTIPVRIGYGDATTIAELLKKVQEGSIKTEAYSYHSLPAIQSLSALGRGLLDHIMVIENYPVPEQVNDADTAGAYRITDVRMFEQTNYDLTLMVVPGKEIQLCFAYDAGQYDAWVIEGAARHLCYILEQVTADAEKPVAQIALTPEAEEQQLLYGFNDTARPYPDTETITSLFEKQAAIVPDNIALRYEDEGISYGMLQSLSEKIAAYLQSEIGVSRGDLVGVMLQREMHLLPLIFGILKAGAAYVPIDPHYPSERIRTIVADAGLKALISRQPHAADGFGCDQIIDLDADLNNILSWTGTFNDPGSNSHDLAYVIYTSGSTGKPKGVMVEHHSVINRLLWMQRSYPLDPSDVLLQKTPLVFDVSVWELFWWSFTGASLYLLPPGGEKDPALIQRVIREQQITTLHFVPSMLNAFLSSLDGTALSSIRRVFASGEALSASDVHLFGNTLQQANGARLINLYGPTEATVDVSCYECLFEGDNTIIPIGKPIDNIRLYVLDQQGAVSPLGVAGELCIAGVGLARGYLNNPLLTAEKFIDHPLLPGERIYKTGDLVKWLPDGNLAFLGRIDHQVKLRGYRIELGEIESCLNSFTGITSAAVLARSRGANKYLVAYYVSAAALDEQTLRAYLQERLPEYMVPAIYVHLDTLPLTVNGKLDRKALPDPVLRTAGDFAAPTGEVEEKLLAIWSDVLSLTKDTISINANFFELGGHSVNIIQLNNRINEQFHRSIPLVDLFRMPTIATQGDFIVKGDQRLKNMEENIDEMLNVVNDTLGLLEDQN